MVDTPHLDAMLARADSVSQPKVSKRYVIGSYSAYHKSRGLIEVVEVKELITDKWGDASVAGTTLDVEEKTGKVVNSSPNAVYRVKDLWKPF